MPYLKDADKPYLNFGIPETPGELNWLFTEIAKSYWEYNPHEYRTLNTIIGAFECAKQEFYRRVVVPYEEQKRFENGDVYDNKI